MCDGVDSVILPGKMKEETGVCLVPLLGSQQGLLSKFMSIGDTEQEPDYHLL